VALELARTLAEYGKRTLLVDCHLRHAQIHGLVAVPNLYGLTSYVASERSVDEVVCATLAKNLSVVPAGQLDVHPADLLGSPEMRNFLTTAREKFDVIVLDSAPVLPVSDAIVLAAQADLAIVVLRTSKDALRTGKLALDRLQAHGSQSTAVVIGERTVRRSERRYHDQRRGTSTMLQESDA
jgi:capsular exopolysaccharide synthesis family protein